MEHSTDLVAWAREVNARWLVQSALKDTAAAYLDYLEHTDRSRLVRVCTRARQLTDRHGVTEDPKPWFYAAIFSQATDAEARQFLSEHAFTCAAIPNLAKALPKALHQDEVSATTWDKIVQIRHVLTCLEDE